MKNYTKIKQEKAIKKYKKKLTTDILTLEKYLINSGDNLKAFFSYERMKKIAENLQWSIDKVFRILHHAQKKKKINT